MDFSFHAVFLENFIEMSKKLMLMDGPTSYSDLWLNEYMGLGELCWTRAELQALNNKVSQLLKVVVGTTAERCNTGLFLLKSSVLEHLSRISCGY